MKPNAIPLSEGQRAALLQQLVGQNRAQPAQPLRRQIDAHLAVDRRSLLSLFAAGELGGVDAVSIGTLSDLLLAKANDAGERWRVAELNHDLPIFWSVRTLSHGRIASLVVPRFYMQIYADRPGIIALVNRSLHMARLLGARCVSLTGLLASATGYGTECALAPDLPTISTGHATTASAVVLAIRDLLALAGRTISAESVAFVGLGSVGSTALRLTLNVLGHPRRLALCDVYQKQETVEKLIAGIRHEDHYEGEVSFHQSRGEVPDSLYESTFLVGATNVPDVVDVRRLTAGALVVDDSDPHCFSVERAFERLEEREDILFTEGGALRSPAPIDRLVFAPAGLDESLPDPGGPDGAWTITGCVLSSLLSATHGYPATLGLVELRDALAHYRGLIESGFSSAPLHCGSRMLPPPLVASFRARFGNRETA